MRQAWILAVLFGCSGAPEAETRLLVSPSPELLAAPQLTRAIDRINAATGCPAGSGCEVTIADEGMPIRFAEEAIVYPDGTEAGGVSNGKEIWLSRASCLEYILMHEIGHRRGAVGKVGSDHSETGVMWGGSPDRSPQLELEHKSWLLTDESLTAMCSGDRPCLQITPEALAEHPFPRC